ncbi:hypothetical protein BS47DRAFT_1367662 [Hydnum rufescens UP504]|uniref:Uncharacterized protein n=1 Tax=Hydnum rufescens UP504 TaxID=1448309 RepID=A0A9P6AJI4_9AGAM|nr:hypothetical protein BS47DRAFT_1367662 [Hydnum rufescens UP504]
MDWVLLLTLLLFLAVSKPQPFFTALQLLTQDLQTAVLSRLSLMPAFLMAKKPHHTKPVVHASDSTVRPTCDSTATCRSNRSKLKEEALPTEPNKESNNLVSVHKDKSQGQATLQKKAPKEGTGGGDSEGIASSTVLKSPQTLAPKSRVKTYQKCSAQPQDIGKGPEKAAPPLLAPQKLQTRRMAHSDPARFDSIVLESPTWPSKSNASGGCPFPDVNPTMPMLTPTPTPTPTPAPAPCSSPSPSCNPHFQPIPNMPHTPKQDSLAAEVAEGLEGPGDEVDGFSRFPADQFEEPLDSEEEQRRLLGLPTASETKEFGPNAGHTTYSKNPGEALEDAEAPSSSDCVVPSFDDSSRGGIYVWP